MRLWRLAALAAGLLAPLIAHAGPCTASIGFTVCAIDDVRPASAAPATDEVTVDENGKSIRLVPNRWLADNDVAKAGVGANPQSGQPDVWVVLKDPASLRLAILTRASVGRRMAVLIDGAVVQTATIEAPVLAGHLEFGERLSDGAARALVARIRRQTV